MFLNSCCDVLFRHFLRLVQSSVNSWAVVWSAECYEESNGRSLSEMTIQRIKGLGWWRHERKMAKKCMVNGLSDFKRRREEKWEREQETKSCRGWVSNFCHRTKFQLREGRKRKVVANGWKAERKEKKVVRRNRAWSCSAREVSRVVPPPRGLVIQTLFLALTLSFLARASSEP